MANHETVPFLMVTDEENTKAGVRRRGGASMIRREYYGTAIPGAVEFRIVPQECTLHRNRLAHCLRIP